MTSIIHAKYRTGSLRMLFREYSCKNAGVAGYAEAFTTVLSGKQASETGGYLAWIILEHKKYQKQVIGHLSDARMHLFQRDEFRSSCIMKLKLFQQRKSRFPA